MTAHLADAQAHLATREAVIARGADSVAPGALWDGDPGVTVDLNAVPVALPNGDPSAIRGALASAFSRERARWARHGVAARVRSLASNARGLRANALRAALTVDDPTGIVLGWPDPDVAARVLGQDFATAPQRGRHGVSLPVAVAIGAGATSLAAHQSARGHGWGPDVRGAAQAVPVNSTLVEVVGRLLLDGQPVDLHALVARIRAESEV